MAAPKKKRKPTIEERLEAITQTLELVAAMQLVNEKQLERFEQFTLINLTSHHRRITKLEKGRA